MSEILPVLWTPDELIRILQGVWLVRPGNSWKPLGLRAMLPERRNPPYSPNYINIIFNQRQLDKAREQLSGRNGGGALVLNASLASATDLSWSKVPIFLLPPQSLPIANLAVAARARFSGRIVAVVGSVGKTTTRRLISSILEAKGRVATNIGNWNFQPHVFEQLSSIDPNTDYYVAELGLGQKNVSIASTVQILRPHVVVFTHLGVSHVDMISHSEDLDNSEVLAQVLALKGQAFTGLNRFGTAIINADMPLAAEAIKMARRHTPNVITYGEATNASCQILSYESTPDGGNVAFLDGKQRVETPLRMRGKAISQNVLAAWSVAKFFHFKPDEILPEMSNWDGIKGRSKLLKLEIEGAQVSILDDSFNATPLSVVTCLSTIAETARTTGATRTIAVLGDILHVGPDSDRIHADLAGNIISNNIDLVFTRGDHMLNLHNALPENKRGAHCSTNDELVQRILPILRNGDILAVKASTPLRFREIVASFQEAAKLRLNIADTL
ncbi:Mur ligase family protein [uncultured Sulfitobacter sp.]|uniref:Mur ligase family protein n=1 Tax=uncultured Sulfitobacter sp. TaxID=191468 RepID=UPI00262B00D2|nr:Mur ligase family protein [uncultured Sulfitobacter sp.]